jgi:two-component system chemotaxis response regulator CheY
MRILIAEDSQTQAVDLRRRLEGLGHEVIVTWNGAQAWNHLQSKPERIVISDWMMPEMNGPDLCRKIRSEIKSRYVYIILLTAKTHRHERLQGLNAGADDFLSKPIGTCELEIALKTAQRIIAAQEVLQSRAQELERANEELTRLASLDELTGLKNLRGFHEALAASFQQAREDRLPLSLIRFELDLLDSTLTREDARDRDEFMIRLANAFRAECRDRDIPARLSSHGFAVIMPGVTEDSALAVADILVGAAKEQRATRFTVTASAGVATMLAENQPSSPTEFFEHAERALARARAQGGDRVVSLDPLVRDLAQARSA